MPLALLAGFLGLALWSDVSWPCPISGPRGEPGVAVELQLYSPGSQQMTLKGWLRHSVSGGTLLRGIFHDGTEIEAVPGEIEGNRGFPFELDLEVPEGRSSLTLSVIHAGEKIPFVLGRESLTRSVFQWRNLLFLIGFGSCLSTGLLLANHLGLKGIDAWFAVPLFAFLLLTGSALILSPLKLLGAGEWTALLMLCCLISFWITRRSPSPNGSLVAPAEVSIKWFELLLTAAIAAPAFFTLIGNPITSFDDLMYHGSRAGYWLTNQSALPFLTHNERVRAFPLGGDLPFAFGVIVTLAEGAGKFLVFLAYPMGMLGIFLFLIWMRVRRFLALAAAIVFGTTPLVVVGTSDIKPDLWTVYFCLAALYWTLRARGQETSPRCILFCGLAGAGIGAGLGVKFVLLPLLLLLPLAILRGAAWRKRFAAAAVALGMALLAGGAFPVLLSNTVIDGNPLGSKGLRAYHLPDPGVGNIALNFLRVPFILLGVPSFPNEAASAEFSSVARSVALKLGLVIGHSQEKDGVTPVWPSYPQVDRRFSLAWGIAILGLVAVGAAWRKFKQNGEAGSVLIILSMALCLFAFVIATTRFLPLGLAPDRHLFVPLALGLVLFALGMDRWGVKAAYGTVGVCILMAIHLLAYIPLARNSLAVSLANGLRRPVSADSLPATRLKPVILQLPPGIRILAFGEQMSLDYPLFDPLEGFANRVYTWDKKTGGMEVLENFVNTEKGDAVVFIKGYMRERDWHPPADVDPLIQVMNARPEFVRLTSTGSVVAFLRVR